MKTSVSFAILFIVVCFCCFEKVIAQNCTTYPGPAICYVSDNNSSNVYTDFQTVNVGQTWVKVWQLKNGGSSCNAFNSTCNAVNYFLSIKTMTRNGVPVTPSTYINSFNPSPFSIPKNQTNYAQVSNSFNQAGTYFITYNMHFSNGQILPTIGSGLTATVTVNAVCSGWATTPTTPNTFPVNGGNGSFSVTTTVGGCSFSAASNNSWINTISYSSGGIVNYHVDVSPGGARTGTISVKDANNVTQTSFTINQNGGCPTISVSTLSQTNVSPCSGNNNGSVTISASGGNTPYLFSKDGGNFFQSSNTFSGLFAGTYQIKVKDNSNCVSGNYPITITQPSAVVFFISSNNVSCSNCNNGNISVFASGGIGPYQYSRNNGNSWQTSSFFSNLSAGTYSIQVKDANNCISTVQNVTISQPAVPPVVSFVNVSNNNVPAGTAITFSASISNNPTSWNWVIKGGTPYTPQTFNSENPTVVFNTPGSYTVTLQASNNAGSSNVYSTPLNYITVRPTSSAQTQPPGSYAIKEEHPYFNIADPINIATGSYGYKHSDFHIPAIGTTLNFTRYYNTVNAAINSPLGFGWSHSYDFYIANSSDTLWTIHYGNGHSASFIPLYSGNGASFSLFGGTYEKLNKDPTTGNFSLTFKTGEVYNFNSLGKLASIVDLNGNTTLLGYTSGNLTAITAPGGRTLTLSYTGQRIATITDPLGRTVGFNYDGNGDLIQATEANSGTTSFLYNAHLITKITMPNGNTLLTNIYDGQSRVISQLDGLNMPTNIAYNTPSAGEVTITYPDNNTLIVHHDNYYRLTQEKDELGFTKKYTYDHNNNLSSEIDENGNISHYSNDTLGNCLTALKPINTSVLYSFNAFCRPIRIINPTNDTSKLAYNAQGKLVQLALPHGSISSFTYYNNGLLHTSIDALNRLTTYNYNSFGDVTSIISPSGTKTLSYDAVGRLLTERDENNHTRTVRYNNNDKVIDVTDPLGNEIIDSFDANNNLIVSQDKNGNETHLYYDVKDRLTSIKDPAGAITTFTYDLRDNLKTKKDANNHTITYQYDGKNRLTSLANSLGTTYFGYDPFGNKISETDALGNTTHYTFDSLHRITANRDQLGNQTSFSYDAKGQLVKITDPLGRNTSYSYSKLGLIASTIDAAGNITSAVYDLKGNKSSITDPNGHIQHFSYDNSDRLKKHTDAEGHVDSFIYDGVGNLITKINPKGIISLIYDSADRVKTIINPDGNNYNYSYDANGNVLSMQNNTGASVFVYDSLNRLKQHTDMFGKTVAYTYDAVGNKKSIKYPGNKIVSYNYNNDNQLTEVTDWLNNTTKYSYNFDGRLKSMIYPNGDTCAYTYDIAGRLTSQSNILSGAIINRSTFTLSANGNRIKEQITGPIPKRLKNASFMPSYGLDDHIISDSTATYTFDGAGNRAYETNALGTTQYNFTADNLLKSITTSTTSTSFRYDAFLNRVEKTIAGTKIRHVLDLSDELSKVLQEQDSIGTVKADYIYGLGLISRVDTAGKTLYYHYNAQHNTVALTNDSGLVTDTYTYLSFGTILNHIGNTTQPFTFMGEYGVQQETPSLYYIRARYYDSKKNGTFLSKDIYPSTLYNPQSLNRYSYGLNNPISIFDPSGLFGQRDNQNHNADWETVKTNLLNGIQLGLDLGGLVPVFGEPLDLINAGIYGLRGDYVNAGLSAGGAIPFVGWGATVGKLTTKVVRFTNNQQTLIKIVKDAKKLGGVTLDEVKILKSWANEFNLPFRGPEIHPNRPFNVWHIHLGPIQHIKIKE